MSEKEIYEEKAKRIEDVVSKILSMNSFDLITPEMRVELEKYGKEAGQLYRKLHNNEFEVAIVGLEKAGKSSFSNALIKKNLLPTDDQRCTYTSTCIKYKEEDEAKVTFYTREEFERDFADKLRRVGIEQADKYPYMALTLAEYQKLYEEQGDDQGRYSDTLNEDIQNMIRYRDQLRNYLGSAERIYKGNALREDEFQGFIRKPEQAIAVKEVQIGSSLLKEMENAVIFDVPGYNSPTEMHREQTIEKMSSADAIVMVAKGDEPSLTADVLKIFRQTDADGIEFKDKLFVFANKSDRANDFEENREITYQQWMDKYQYIHEKSRIIFGSANAYLQANGELEGKNFIEEVEKKRLPDGDGIEKMRHVLADYNSTERFEVLKRRVNTLQKRIKEIFDGVEKCQENSENQVCSAELAMKLYAEATERIPEALDNCLADIRGQVIENKPFTKEIQNKIDEIITEDDLITDEEIEKCHKASTGVSNDMRVGHVDNAIRDEKLYSMYQHFSEKIVGMVVEEHTRCSDQILKACLCAIGVEEGSIHIEEISQNLYKEMHDILGSRENRGFYQSLVERFSRDLFEILIGRPYNSERLERFYVDQERFFSLAVFYDPEETGELWECPVNDLPMTRLLLFHTEKEQKEKIEQAVGKIKNLVSDSEKLVRCVLELGKAEPVEALRIVEEICQEVSGIQDERQRRGDAEQSLREAWKRSNSVYKAKVSDREQFVGRYREFHASRGEINYESVKEDFAEDVEILKDILKNAVVFAIDIEKPFIAREQKVVEDIKEFIKGEEFRSFLANNIWMIKAKECGAIEEREARRMRNENCWQAIKGFLNEIEA